MMIAVIEEGDGGLSLCKKDWVTFFLTFYGASTWF